MWVLAVLFIGVGLVIFRMTMPTIIFEGGTGFSLLSIFESKGVIISLLVSALIVILFLSLKIGGVFG